MKLASLYLLLLGILLIYGYNIKQSDYRNVSAYSKKPSIVKQKAKIRQDKNVGTLEFFFRQFNSPLAGSSADFIDAAKVYGLDWRLLPAIAGVESTFETAGNVYDHNPFGYMCRGVPCYFNSYSEGIWQVAKTISTNGAYKDFQQSKSIYELAKTYNQVYPEAWTNHIEYFMRKI